MCEQFSKEDKIAIYEYLEFERGVAIHDMHPHVVYNPRLFFKYSWNIVFTSKIPGGAVDRFIALTIWEAVGLLLGLDPEWEPGNIPEICESMQDEKLRDFTFKENRILKKRYRSLGGRLKKIEFIERHLAKVMVYKRDFEGADEFRARIRNLHKYRPIKKSQQ